MPLPSQHITNCVLPQRIPASALGSRLGDVYGLLQGVPVAQPLPHDARASRYRSGLQPIFGPFVNGCGKVDPLKSPESSPRAWRQHGSPGPLIAKCCLRVSARRRRDGRSYGRLEWPRGQHQANNHKWLARGNNYQTPRPQAPSATSPPRCGGSTTSSANPITSTCAVILR